MKKLVKVCHKCGYEWGITFVCCAFPICNKNNNWDKLYLTKEIDIDYSFGEKTP